MIDNTDFKELVLASCPSVYSEDRFPLVDYDEAGDCMEVFQSDEHHYGDRIDGRVTIYVGQDSGEIVGVLVKGLSTWISRILKQFPGFQLDVKDSERQVLGILFHLGQLEEKDPKLQMQYKKLSKATSDWEIHLPEQMNIELQEAE